MRGFTDLKGFSWAGKSLNGTEICYAAFSISNLHNAGGSWCFVTMLAMLWMIAFTITKIFSIYKINITYQHFIIKITWVKSVQNLMLDIKGTLLVGIFSDTNQWNFFLNIWEKSGEFYFLQSDRSKYYKVKIFLYCNLFS